MMLHLNRTSNLSQLHQLSGIDNNPKIAAVAPAWSTPADDSSFPPPASDDVSQQPPPSSDTVTAQSGSPQPQHDRSSSLSPPPEEAAAANAASTVPKDARSSEPSKTTSAAADLSEPTANGVDKSSVQSPLSELSTLSENDNDTSNALDAGESSQTTASQQAPNSKDDDTNKSKGSPNPRASKTPAPSQPIPTQPGGEASKDRPSSSLSVSRIKTPQGSAMSAPDQQRSDAKVAKVLELNSELLNVCISHQVRGIPPHDPRVKPYSDRLQGNLSWLAAACDQTRFQTLSAHPLPHMEPPPPATVEHIPSTERIHKLYTEMSAVFANEISRRRQQQQQQQQHQNSPSIAAGLTLPMNLKRDRPPDDLSMVTENLTKRRDTGEHKMGSGSVMAPPPPQAPGAASATPFAPPMSASPVTSMGSPSTPMVPPAGMAGAAPGAGPMSIANGAGMMPSGQSQQQPQTEAQVAAAMRERQRQVQIRQAQQQIAAQNGMHHHLPPQQQQPQQQQQQQQQQPASASSASSSGPMQPPMPGGGAMGMNGAQAMVPPRSSSAQGMDPTTAAAGAGGMPPNAMAYMQMLQTPGHSFVDYMQKHVPGFNTQSTATKIQHMHRMQSMMQKARSAQMQPPMQPHANNMVFGGHNQLPGSGGGGGGGNQLNPMAGGVGPGGAGATSMPMHMQLPQQPMGAFPMNPSSSQMGSSAMPGGAGGAFTPQQQQQARQYMMMQQQQMRAAAAAGAGGGGGGGGGGMNPGMMNPQQAYTQQLRMEQQQRLAQAMGHAMPPSAPSAAGSPVSASSPSDPALMGLRSNPVMSSIARTTQSPAESISSPMTPQSQSQSRLPSASYEDFQRGMMQQQQQQNAAAVAGGQQQPGWSSMQQQQHQQNAVGFNHPQMGGMNGMNPMAAWQQQQQQNLGQGSAGQSVSGLPGLAMGQIQAGNTFSMPLSAGPTSSGGAGAQFSPAASSPVRSWSPSTAAGMGGGNMGSAPFPFTASPAPSHHGDRPTTPRHPASSSSTPAPGIPDDMNNMFNWPAQ